jgi:hypothetical protein
MASFTVSEAFAVSSLSGNAGKPELKKELKLGKDKKKKENKKKGKKEKIQSEKGFEKG